MQSFKWSTTFFLGINCLPSHGILYSSIFYQSRNRSFNEHADKIIPEICNIKFQTEQKAPLDAAKYRWEDNTEIDLITICKH
jgi:hypothetical protein